MDEKILRHTIKRLFNVRAGRASYEGIHKRVIAGTRIDGLHVCQLIAAMIIASIGLNVDSTEAIVGAMLICPLMGSVLAIAYSIATVDTKLLKSAFVGLLIQFGVCLFTSTIYFLISPLAGETSKLLTNSYPTIWDVLLALVGGFAGALGMSRQQEPETLIAGVAVATSLMPPLCATGYGLAVRDLVLSASALYEFLVNVVFISFGAEMAFLMLRVPVKVDLNDDGVVTPEEEARAKENTHEMRMRVLASTLLFALPCFFFSARMVREQVESTGTVFEVRDQYETEVTTRELSVVCDSLVSYRVGEEDSYDEKNDMLVQQVMATVVTDEELEPEEQRRLEQLIRLHVEDLDEVEFKVSE